MGPTTPSVHQMILTSNVPSTDAETVVSTRCISPVSSHLSLQKGKSEKQRERRKRGKKKSPLLSHLPRLITVPSSCSRSRSGNGDLLFHRFRGYLSCCCSPRAQQEQQRSHQHHFRLQFLQEQLHSRLLSHDG